MNDGKWITLKDGRRIFIDTSKYMNDKIRKNKNKQKKVDYQKYLQERDKTIAKYIAPGGKVDVLSEEKANELLNLGVDEELLPHAYPLKDEYSIKEAMKYDENWVQRYIEDAKKTKERDDRHVQEQLEWEKEKQKISKIESAIDSLDYDGKGSKKYTDYDTDQANYEIDDNTLETITNNWAYKDSTVDYFGELDDATQQAILDYTDENAKYNYRVFNNILNEHWEQKELDELGKKNVELIDKAIDGSVIDEDIYLYRNSDIIHIKDDMTMSNKGFMSTSLYKEVVEEFDNPYILKIRVPKGTKGLYIGTNTMSWNDESEVLLGRNVQLKIIDRNKDGTIECEIIKKR